MRQNKIHGFTLVDQDWIRLMIFKNSADQDWIGYNFCGSEKFHSPLISALYLIPTGLGYSVSLAPPLVGPA